jgi:hypothetical protein
MAAMTEQQKRELFSKTIANVINEAEQKRAYAAWYVREKMYIKWERHELSEIRNRMGGDSS